MAKNRKDDHCAFCGRGNDEVELMLHGEDVCICSDCVTAANAQIQSILHPPIEKAIKTNGHIEGDLQLKKPSEIYDFLS